MSGEAVFDCIQLVDVRGVVIASSPIGTAWNHGMGVDWGAEPIPVTRSTSDGGGLVAASPIHQSGRLQGYVVGHLNPRAALRFMAGDNFELALLLDERGVIYTSHPEMTVDGLRLREFTAKAKAPADLESGAVRSSGEYFSERQSLKAFFAEIPGYPFILYWLELYDTTGGKRTPLIFKISMVVLTLGSFIIGILFLRAGARNLVLETSLRETEKKNAEVAEKVEELEWVIKGAGLAVWKWDIPGHQVHCDGCWGEIFGCLPEGGLISIGALQDLVHHEDSQQVALDIAKHLHGGEPHYFSEHRLRHHDGHWVWVRMAGKVQKRDSTGRPLHAFGILQDITQNKTANEQLEKAKEESDRIIRAFLDSLIVVDLRMKVLRINPATCSLLGQTEAALLGRDIAELFHDPEGYVHDIFSFYRQVVLGHTPPERDELRNIELSYRDAQGGRLPMSFNLSVLKNDTGEITGVVAGAKDISKMRLVIDELARQKEYIETLFDIIPEGLLALSEQGQIVKQNRASGDLLGNWTRQLELPGEDLARVLVSEVISRHGADRSIFTFTIKGRGEERVYCKCNAVTIAGLQGMSLLVSLADITLERLRQEEKKLLATIIEQMDESVIITGTDMVIRYANPAVSRNSGFSNDELLGKTPAVFKSGLVGDQVYEEMFKALERGTVWSGRLRNRRKNGAIVEEDVKISPVRNEKGEMSHYVAIKRDMTELTNLQRQLLQAQKLEAIGHLSAGIAHEINTPIQYVQNNISFFGQAFGDLETLFRELARAGESDNRERILECLATVNLDYLREEIPEAIKEANEGIERVVRIVSAMKTFSHPGSPGKVLTDINQALDSTATVCRNEYKYIAEMSLDLEENLPPVPCYPDQLNQAILNLIINAAHAIEETGARFPDNPGRIIITSRLIGNVVEIRVQDTGTGIPAEIQSFIFDPFFTTKEVGKGTGQGLTIVHDVVVRKHGGTLDFLTEKGVGTTFVLRLPSSDSREKS